MINIQKIQTAFNQYVGYKEEQDITLDTNLQVSNSGFYVNDIPGVDLQSIDKSQWIKDDLTHKTVSDYLEGIYNSTLLDMVYNFINQLQAKYVNTELKSEKYIMNNAPTKKGTQKERFVGYYIKLKDSSTLRMVLKSIALQCDTAQIVRIFLYEMNTRQPLFEHDLVIAEDKARNYEALTDKILTFKTDNSSGNTYLLGFYENVSDNPQSWQLDIDSEVYIVEQNITVKSEFATIIPISIDKSFFDWNGTTYLLPTSYTDEITNNYDNLEGLSFSYKIDCDYTDMIIDNMELFAKILQYELGKRIINDSLNSKVFNQITESNRTEWAGLLISFDNTLSGYSYKDSKDKELYNKGLYAILIENFKNIDCECFNTGIIPFM